MNTEEEKKPPRKPHNIKAIEPTPCEATVGRTQPVDPRTEAFEKAVQAHSDEGLLGQIYIWVDKLCKTGGEAWCLSIPPHPTRDPDILITELCRRYAALLERVQTMEQKGTPEERGILNALRQIFAPTAQEVRTWLQRPYPTGGITQPGNHGDAFVQHMEHFVPPAQIGTFENVPEWDAPVKATETAEVKELRDVVRITCEEVRELRERIGEKHAKIMHQNLQIDDLHVKNKRLESDKAALYLEMEQAIKAGDTMRIEKRGAEEMVQEMRTKQEATVVQNKALFTMVLNLFDAMMDFPPLATMRDSLREARNVLRERLAEVNALYPNIHNPFK